MTIEILFSMIDVGAKILFTFTMVYQNMEKLQSLKVTLPHI